MTNKDITQIARACKLAATIREDSWLGDNVGKYGLDMLEACHLACEQLEIPVTFARLMDLAFHWWNDVLDWAESPEKDYEECIKIDLKIKKKVESHGPSGLNRAGWGGLL